MAVSKACAVGGLSRAAFYKTGESAVQRDVEVIDALKDSLKNTHPA